MEAPDLIVFEVRGLPQPQGSKVGRLAKGQNGKLRAIVVDDVGPRLGEWRRACGDAARRWLDHHPRPPLDEPVAITLAFRFPPVKGDRFRTRHSSKPDIDKIARGVLDALVQAGLLHDDALVWRLTAEKTYAEDNQAIGVTVTVRACGEDEAADRQQLKDRAAQARRIVRRPPESVQPRLSAVS